MIEFINNKVRLTDLARELEVTPSAVRQHLINNKSGLGNEAEKFSHRITEIDKYKNI